MLKISILDTSLKITDLRLQPHLPGANELMWWLVTFLYQAITLTNGALLSSGPLKTKNMYFESKQNFLWRTCFS